MGFEPTVTSSATPIFEIGTFNHSDTSPSSKYSLAGHAFLLTGLRDRLMATMKCHSSSLEAMRATQRQLWFFSSEGG